MSDALFAGKSLVTCLLVCSKERQQALLLCAQVGPKIQRTLGISPSGPPTCQWWCDAKMQVTGRRPHVTNLESAEDSQAAPPKGEASWAAA